MGDNYVRADQYLSFSVSTHARLPYIIPNSNEDITTKIFAPHFGRDTPRPTISNYAQSLLLSHFEMVDF